MESKLKGCQVSTEAQCFKLSDLELTKKVPRKEERRLFMQYHVFKARLRTKQNDCPSCRNCTQHALRMPTTRLEETNYEKNGMG